MITVDVFNNTTGDNDRISLLGNSTVADALTQVGINAEGAMIRVNQRDASLNQPLGNGDRISVTKKGLKGAQMRTFEDLLTGSTNCQPADNDIVREAQNKRDEEAKKQVVEVYKELLEEADSLGRDVEISIQRLGQELADARKHYNEVQFVLSELRAGRPFPFYALNGAKHIAVRLCQQLGVACPPNDSPCWNTTPPAAAGAQAAK